MHQQGSILTGISRIDFFYKKTNSSEKLSENVHPKTEESPISIRNDEMIHLFFPVEVFGWDLGFLGLGSKQLQWRNGDGGIQLIQHVPEITLSGFMK